MAGNVGTGIVELLVETVGGIETVDGGENKPGRDVPVELEIGGDGFTGTLCVIVKFVVENIVAVAGIPILSMSERVPESTYRGSPVFSSKALSKGSI